MSRIEVVDVMDRIEVADRIEDLDGWWYAKKATMMGRWAGGGRRCSRFAAGAAANAIHGIPTWGELQARVVTQRMASTKQATASAAVGASGWVAKREAPKTTTTQVSSSNTVGIIPTRHSRKLLPPVASSWELPTLVSELLDAKPGSLFSYERSFAALGVAAEKDERETALVAADATRQKVEYTMRGLAALLPETQTARDNVWKRSRSLPGDEDQPPADGHKNEAPYDALTALTLMTRLVERIEQEGRDYVELLVRTKMTPVPVEDEDGEADWAGDDVSSEEQQQYEGPAERQGEPASMERQAFMEQLISEFGSSPGPSVAMYDLLLDAMAILAATTATVSPGQLTLPLAARRVFGRALERHRLDTADGQLFNTNLLTAPTAVTYNATIRCCANAVSCSDSTTETRDDAMETALLAYDSMYHDTVVFRNSATYREMLRLFGRALPPSKSRGNMCYALYHKVTTEERCLDNDILDVLRTQAMTPSNGPDFDKWTQETLAEKSVADLPQFFSANSKRRRHRRFDTTY